MKHLAAMIVAIVCATGIVVGTGSAASAASGRSNQGVSSLSVAPANGSGFSETNRNGWARWSMWDGVTTGYSSYYVPQYQANLTVLTLPERLEFVPTVCEDNRWAEHYTAASYYIRGRMLHLCKLSADRRTLTLREESFFENVRHPYEFTYDFQRSMWSDNWAVVYTGANISSQPISGAATLAYTPFPGLTTQSPFISALPAGVPNPLPSVAITTPTDGAQVDGYRPVVTGTGAPGAEVTLAVDTASALFANMDDDTGTRSAVELDPASAMSTTVGSGVVDSLGVWSIVPTVDLPAGPVTVMATQDASGTISTASVSFILTDDSVSVPLFHLDVDGWARSGAGRDSRSLHCRR